MLITASYWPHRRWREVALGFPWSLGAWHCPGGTGWVVVTQQSENWKTSPHKIYVKNYIYRIYKEKSTPNLLIFVFAMIRTLNFIAAHGKMDWLKVSKVSSQILVIWWKLCCSYETFFQHHIYIQKELTSLRPPLLQHATRTRYVCPGVSCSNWCSLSDPS